MKEALLKKLKGELLNEEHLTGVLEESLSTFSESVVWGPITTEMLKEAHSRLAARKDTICELKGYVQWLENL